jgi:uncharacterized membrane protein
MTKLWRVITLTTYFGLFLLLIAWSVWLEPPRRLPVALVLIVLVGPLLLPLRGLLHGHPYTHAWTSFMALFYFVAGVFNAAGVMNRPWLAWLEIALSVMLFFGAVFYTRAKVRALNPNSS